MYAALVLLAITLVVNIFGALILQRASRELKGAQLMEDPVVRNRAIEAAREAGEAFPLGELERSLRRPRTSSASS